MMSLFSSFDFFFFFKNWLSFFFILSSFSFTKFILSNSNSGFMLMSNFLSSFFYSLKKKAFNKFSLIIFFSVFLFLIMVNFFSVLSYNFAYSSQVGLMFFLSLSMWIMMIFFMISNSSKKLILHFIPEGTPLPLTFLLFLIEMVSNLIRPITLMVRLVANILAGHLLMILLSQLVFLFKFSFFFYMLLNTIEIFVAIIQSYIFATMLTLYYSEV